MIPEQKIQEVLERVDLIGLISAHVTLKKSGRSHVGLCPFHTEKSPSFHVNAELGRFKCYGCEAGGDAIAFVQRYLGKTFVDAVRDLAREVGVDLAEAEDPAGRDRRQLREATEKASSWFRANLEADSAALARAYLEERGVTGESSRTFGLGWAPTAWAGLSELLAREGMADWAAKAGLIQPRRSGDGFYDVFRGRLMIPIRTAEGRCVGFGGRLVEGEGGPKYLNSRESPLYNKSEVLYGADVAKDAIRRKKSVVLVEGYFDAIGLHQAGVRQTLALCSTALTPGHLSLLSRLEAKELILLLDGDEAGRKAVERLAGAILARGSSARVALLPQGEDPDTFARREGQAGTEALLASGRPLSSHLLQTVLPHGADSTFEDKMAALDRLRPTTSQLPVGLTRSAFFGAMAGHFGLRASELEGELRGRADPPRPAPKPQAGPQRAALGPSRPAGGLRPGFPGGSPRTAAGAGEAGAAQPGILARPDPFEAALVALALRAPELLGQARIRPVDEISHPGLRRLLGLITSGDRPDEALAETSPRTQRALEEAAGQLPREEGELPASLARIWSRLRLRRIDEQLSHIARQVAQIASASDLSEETRDLMTQRQELLGLRRRVIEEGPSVNSGRKKVIPSV